MPTPSDVVYTGDVWNYCQYSGITLLVYDYILTLPREITLVWRWPWKRQCRKIPCISMSSLLYVLMRHALLVSWGVTIIVDLYPSAERFVFSLICMAYLTTVALVLLLRTYAMWSRNSLILILTGAVGLGIPGIGIWSIVLTSCADTFDTSVDSQLKLITMLFSLISVIYDFLIVIFTGIRWHQMRRSTNLVQGHLARLIMQNGILQYTFVFFGQLSTVIMFWAAPMELIGVGNYIVRSLGVNILSHFMLDLREMAQVDNGKSMRGTSTVAQTLSFVTFHGSELLRGSGKDNDQDGDAGH